MAKTPPEMTPAEFKLMKVLWSLGHGTVADVRAEHHRRYDNELAYTTVMTLLGRLAAKRALKVDKSRQPFVYKPAFRRESVLRDRLRRFVETVFDGHAESLVLHLVRDESLSLAELRDIERTIEAQGEDDGDDGENAAQTAAPSAAPGAAIKEEAP